MKKENFLKNLQGHNSKVLDYVFDNYGVYDEYKDYTKYIGETTKAGKYEYSEVILSLLLLILIMQNLISMELS